MTTLCFIDTETTGLDPRIHQPYEVCYWREDRDEPTTILVPSTLEYADPQALAIGGYFERILPRLPVPLAEMQLGMFELIEDLHGVTLVGSNPAFDAAMLARCIGTPVWHYRLINVAEGAMWLFDWDRPKGLADITAHLRELGHEIPEPDHTAEGDVRTTRAVYEALRSIRAGF